MGSPFFGLRAHALSLVAGKPRSRKRRPLASSRTVPVGRDPAFRPPLDKHVGVDSRAREDRAPFTSAPNLVTGDGGKSGSAVAKPLKSSDIKPANLRKGPLNKGIDVPAGDEEIDRDLATILSRLPRLAGVGEDGVPTTSAPNLGLEQSAVLKLPEIVREDSLDMAVDVLPGDEVTPFISAPNLGTGDGGKSGSAVAKPLKLPDIKPASVRKDPLNVGIDVPTSDEGIDRALATILSRLPRLAGVGEDGVPTTSAPNLGLERRKRQSAVPKTLKLLDIVREDSLDMDVDVLPGDEVAGRGAPTLRARKDRVPFIPAPNLGTGDGGKSQGAVAKPLKSPDIKPASVRKGPLNVGIDVPTSDEGIDRALATILSRLPRLAGVGEDGVPTTSAPNLGLERRKRQSAVPKTLKSPDIVREDSLDMAVDVLPGDEVAGRGAPTRRARKERVPFIPAPNLGTGDGGKSRGAVAKPLKSPYIKPASVRKDSLNPGIDVPAGEGIDRALATILSRVLRRGASNRREGCVPSAAPKPLKSPYIKPVKVHEDRLGSTGSDVLPSETRGPGHTYKSWMDTKFISNPKGTDTIKWVIKSSGFTTGSLCLADLMERRHAFNDKERAELLLVDVHRQRRASRRSAKKILAAMSPEAMIEPIRHSEKLLPFGVSSLNAYLTLLAVLRLPSEALRVWKSYGRGCNSPKTWLHAIRALLSFATPHRSPRTGPAANSTFMNTAADIFQVYKEEVFDVLTGLADVESDPLKPTSEHTNVTDFYGAVAMMIRVYTKLERFSEADALWQEVGRGATPTAKRAYLARLAGEPTRARELLMSIPELDRTEYDYRTVITAYAQQGNIFEAEKVFSMVPPVTLAQDKQTRVGTTTILLHGYSEQAKLMSDLTPAEQTDMFLKGAESVEKRLEELQFTEETVL